MHANKLFLIGMLSSDLKITYQPNGSPVTEFTLTIDSHGKDDTVFHLYVPCKAWGKTAEYLCEHGETGQTAAVDGKLAYDRETKGLYVMVSSVTLERVPVAAER